MKSKFKLEPEDDYIIPFGKYKDKRIGDVPADYLLWFAEQKWSSKFPDMESYVQKNFQQLEEEANRHD